MKDEYFSLGIGLFEIDWPKNIMNTSHDFSNLFTPADYKDITYYTEDWDVLLPVKAKGYGKKVKEVIPRLNMLGYSFQNLAGYLESYISEIPDYLELPQVDWDKFLRLLSGLDIKKIKWLKHEGDADPGEFLQRRILPIPQLKKMAAVLGTTRKDDLMIFEQIDPFIILAAVAHNPLNHELELEWRYDGELGSGLSVNEKYLIVTEGKTDTRILKKAVEILYPDLSDFFDFIEMNDDYPFAGAGNLANFFKGLLKVRTGRQMVFLFDNDPAGRFEYGRLQKLKYPANFKLLLLPDLADFDNFKTVDDAGSQYENINGSAVAIELFLDLSYKTAGEPFVEWGGQHTTTRERQGALADKNKYVQLFSKLKKEDFHSYNFSKLKNLTDLIIGILTS